MSVETEALRQTLRSQLEDSVKRRKFLQDTEPPWRRHNLSWHAWAMKWG